MINFYYDQITEYGPVPNCAVEFEITNGDIKFPFLPYLNKTNHINSVAMFYDLAIAQGCAVNIFTNGSIVPNLFYPIEVIRPEFSIKDTIPNLTLDFIRQGMIKVLILFQEEGADGWAFSPIKDFANQFIENGVAIDNIYIVLGDLNVTYTEYFKGFKIFGIDWWQPKHQMTCYTRYLGSECRSARLYDHLLSDKDKLRESFEIDNWNKPSKIFLNYNGNKRIHRAGLVSELLSRGLIDSGYVSWGTHPGPFMFNVDDERIVDHQRIDVELKISSMRRLEAEKFILDGDGHEFFDGDDRRYDSKHFYDSAFSIVTETFSPCENKNYPNNEYNTLWTTEKTWKPIAIGHPFIVLGSLGTIRYLKEQGYHTFEELFDESYDSEPDLIKRISMICDNVERLVAMPQSQLYDILDSIKYKLKENRELFYNKNHKDKFDILFGQLNGKYNAIL